MRVENQPASRGRHPARRRAAKWTAAILAAGVTAGAAINIWMVRTAAEHTFTEVEAVPQKPIALVLGVDLALPDGTTNSHFINRTTAAARLFASGKVARLLVSGHPENKGYNEVRGMTAELLRLGVPSDRIDLDEDGRRTWSSIRSAKERWRLRDCIVVTDGFHAPRSLFLCRRAGLEAVAYCQPDATRNRWTMRSEGREWLARIRALADRGREPSAGRQRRRA